MSFPPALLLIIIIALWLYVIINTVSKTNNNIQGVHCPTQVYREIVTIKSNNGFYLGEHEICICFSETRTYSFRLR